MSTLVTTEQPSISASVVAATLPIPFPDVVPETDLYLNFPDFGCDFTAPITDFEYDRQSPKVTVQANLNDDVVISLSLSGALVSNFRIDGVEIDVRKLQESPRANFIASTLVVLLGLSNETHLRIPLIELDLRQRFELSLKSISERLHRRQTAYRLMVIERATGFQFSLPRDYSGEDVKTIAYLYHAIVDRSFVWPTGTISVYVPATQERLAEFPRDDTPTRTPLGPTRALRKLFGQTIDLGEEELFLDDAVIENLAAVRSELASDDGHPVKVIIRPLSGKGVLALRDAPRLPESAWDSHIQSLLDLESQLDALLADRFCALAESTLADLSDEEKRDVTARPELDEEAFC